MLTSAIWPIFSGTLSLAADRRRRRPSEKAASSLRDEQIWPDAVVLAQRCCRNKFGWDGDSDRLGYTLEQERDLDLAQNCVDNMAEDPVVLLLFPLCGERNEIGPFVVHIVDDGSGRVPYLHQRLHRHSRI